MSFSVNNRMSRAYALNPGQEATNQGSAGSTMPLTSTPQPQYDKDLQRGEPDIKPSYFGTVDHVNKGTDNLGQRSLAFFDKRGDEVRYVYSPSGQRNQELTWKSENEGRTLSFDTEYAYQPDGTRTPVKTPVQPPKPDNTQFQPPKADGTAYSLDHTRGEPDPKPWYWGTAQPSLTREGTDSDGNRFLSMTDDKGNGVDYLYGSDGKRFQEIDFKSEVGPNGRTEVYNYTPGGDRRAVPDKTIDWISKPLSWPRPDISRHKT